ncbi:hypothetical protein VTI28DRAFT_548 [Corynascus sepedonium]
MGPKTNTTKASAAVSPPTIARASERKRKGIDAERPTSSAIIASNPGVSARKQTFQNASVDDDESCRPSKKPRLPKATATAPEEKRLRKFRPEPPNSFQDLYLRATTQRFYVLSRVRHQTDPSPPSSPSDLEEPFETVELTGSTGNIYTVTIARQPTCNCPHALKGNQCKHVVYVLARVLRAKFEYVYQLALLGSELREILEEAPPLQSDEGGFGGNGNGKRKPVEGDCPICFCEMEGQEGTEPVVWCRAACGQNVHKACFETWAATKRRQAHSGGGGEVTCPYCRSVWEGDEDMLKTIRKDGKRNADGYVNVASQLGITPHRDYSTYSKWWSGHPSSYRRRWY